MDEDLKSIIGDDLIALIDERVKFIGHLPRFFSQPNDIRLKIDILDRMIEVVRIHLRHMQNEISFEEFIQGHAGLANDAIIFSEPDRFKSKGTGTKPIHLQPALLLFLLFRFNRYRETVYDIIDTFIHTMWDQLTVLDFKKTQTGVTRCFTNTRFAANTLRNYGLLKFTRKEAYKTWVLSLPGFLVASKVMEQGKRKPTTDFSFDLHPDIRSAFDDLKSYGNFVQRLTTICKPTSKVFDEFKEGSKRAYALLSDYWVIINDQSLTKEERWKKSTAKVKRIDQDPEIFAFYEKFLQCLKAGDILSLKVY